MGKRDKRIDAYIMRAADFARPILEHLRELVHKACPEVEETMKWSFPHFEYKGILCSMASFTHHCAFGFWKTALMSDPHRIMNVGGKTAMGSLGRITKAEDLPSDKILLQYIKEAAQLNNQKIKLPSRSKPKGEKTLEIPDYFMKALKKDRSAFAVFSGFSYSSRKDYVEWITEAKTEATRNKRLATAMEWLAEGKTRHWKYQRKSKQR